MCFDDDSAPPVPRITGAAVSHERLVLQAADGNRLDAFVATPDDGPGGACVVVLPDIRGLDRFYEELALRFAEHGHPAVAIDYFGRTAGTGPRPGGFDHMAHVDQTTQEGIQADVGAAVAHLRALGCAALVTVGFCLGGRHSWLATAAGHGLAGAVGFYGRPGTGRDGSPGPTDRAAQLRGPILALMGGDDPGIPVEDVDALEAALDAAGVENEIVTYPGAPHSFFDRKQDEFAAESEDAWNRVLAFLERVS
jgi:carboxymethylenebutenolidase